ncbi:hypothetical protein GCM10010965_14610 [Caldalkalibacillus thermarum]|uniref:hypothetical protein n=1 Tax=Caldalkalibacillus thermarum TaxID=296745 RepID=UPI001665FD6F|nr:hypothetical protein [Caldalkalibacillus thermarum]GGK22792.1 hypothetical protein GCM10010965_14610 [Caldalkalibacillus thermarum]
MIIKTKNNMSPVGNEINQMRFIKKVKDVAFYYERCSDGSFKVIADSELQQKSTILAYENSIEGVFNCVNVFSRGFNLNGFELNISE